ncbi:MAG: VOC family protein [Geminicoccaceae bacterium]
MSSGRAIDHLVLAVPDLDRAGEAYEELGFTLTPRAAHDDRMGTSNRLAQFAGRNFIELLEVDRPDRLLDHDCLVDPPFFSFGAHNRAFIEGGSGVSMLVFQGNDARADIQRFQAQGIATHAPFDFQRPARLPDGTKATVAFTLAFATSPDMPRLAFFVCQNRAPDYFWKPDFQDHANGALDLIRVYLASPDPAREARFLSRLFGGESDPIEYGFRVACGEAQEIWVVDPDVLADKDPSLRATAKTQPHLAGFCLRCRQARDLIPASEAQGAFIKWIAEDGA